MSLTLIGDVLISLVLTFVADGLGRRNVLILGSLMMAFSGVIFCIFSNYWILLFAAVVGVISPSGNEIGPFRAVEEAALAQLTEAATRSDVFAWCVVLSTLGLATGSLGGGWLVQALQAADWEVLSTYRFVFGVYAVVGLLKAGLSFMLSEKCEVRRTPVESADDGEEEEPFLGSRAAPKGPASPKVAPKKKSAFAQISPASRITLYKLCSLFFLDSLASGMAPASLIAFYLETKFALPEGQLGSIMSSAQFVSSIGNVFASAVAKRIGLVRAMVFTHLPSAIFLALLPAPPYLSVTIVLLVLRSSMASMDQAPRSAFLSAVVLPEERTATMGIANTVRTLSQSSGPLITGVLAGKKRFWIAFVVAGALKASYDLGMLGMFVSLKIEGDTGGARKSTTEVPAESDNAAETEMDNLPGRNGNKAS